MAIPAPTTVGDLTKLNSGDLVDLGAAGKYIKNADGTYAVAPTLTAPDKAPVTPPGTASPGSAVLSSSGARDAISKASAYITANTPPPQAPQTATPATYSAPVQKAQTLASGQFGYVKNQDGTFTYYDSNGNTLATNPIGGDNYNANPQATPNSQGKLIQLSAPPTAPGASTSSTGNAELDAYTSKIQGSIDQATADITDFKTKADAIVSRLDSANASVVQSITANYAAAIAKQQKVNQAYLQGVTQSGIRSGLQRYAADDYSAQVMKEANDGIDRITKLENERDGLIAQANAANSKQDWDIYYQVYEELQKNRDAQNKNLQDIYEKSQALVEAAQKNASDQLDSLSKTQAIQEKTIDSIANLADVTLAEYEKNSDTAGGEKFIKDLADQYGIDPGQLLSKVQSIRQANKGWSDAYIDKATGQQVQRNLQNGEVRVIYTPSKSNGGVDQNGTVTTIGGQGIVAGQKVDPTIAGDVEDVLSGRNTLYNIRQTMGRTNQAAQYMASMRDAIRAIDPSFDFVASDAGGKFVSSTFYQKAISAITSVEPNIDKAVDLSNQVNRIGIAGVDNLLQKAAVQIGNVKVSNFREAQKLISDEIGLALGQGTVSDMKLQLGFDVTDPSVSQEVFASNMGLVKQFIQNRKQALQDQRYHSSTVDSSASANAASSDRVTVTSPEGKTGTIPKSQLSEALKQGYTQTQ